MTDRRFPPKTDQKLDVAVLMTDRLALGSLGAYGNAAAETPAFDRLACEATLFDRHNAATLSLEGAYRSYWTGTNPTLNGDSGVLLAEAAAERGYLTVLVTDTPALTRLESARFERIVAVDAPKPSEAAETVEETAIYRFFLQTAETLIAARREGRPVFLWAHTAGFGGPWDFPLALRSLFQEDEEDPAPYAGLEPPYAELFAPNAFRKRSTAADTRATPDFDRLCEIAESYAAGCSVWDRGLEAFSALLSADRFFENGLLVLGSPRGFPLGEHGRVGFQEGREPLLYAEDLHLPLLIRFLDRETAAVRSDALTGPVDLYRTLRSALDGQASDGALGDLAAGRRETIRPFLRQTLLDASSRLCGLTTPEWFLRLETDDTGRESTELYVRPDDRRDVNEVASRCGETADELKALLRGNEAAE